MTSQCHRFVLLGFWIFMVHQPSTGNSAKDTFESVHQTDNAGVKFNVNRCLECEMLVPLVTLMTIKSHLALSP